jgi:hypothetical protein
VEGARKLPADRKVFLRVADPVRQRVPLILFGEACVEIIRFVRAGRIVQLESRREEVETQHGIPDRRVHRTEILRGVLYAVLVCAGRAVSLQSGNDDGRAATGETVEVLLRTHRIVIEPVTLVNLLEERQIGHSILKAGCGDLHLARMRQVAGDRIGLLERSGTEQVVVRELRRRLDVRVRHRVRGVDEGRLLRGAWLREETLLRVVLRERLDLEAASQLFVKQQVPPLLGARRGIHRKNRVVVVANQMLLDRQIRMVRRIVTKV